MYIDSMYLRLSNSIRKRDNQWRIQEFQHRGARSRRGRILKSWVCFEAPLHMPYVFVVRVVNKLHVVNIVCWLKSSKYIRVIQSLQKLPPIFFQTGGRAAGAPVLDPPMIIQEYLFWNVITISFRYTTWFLVSVLILEFQEIPQTCIATRIHSSVCKGKQKTEQRNRQ